MKNNYYIDKTHIVNDLRLEYDHWINILNEQEVHAIRKYSWNSMDMGIKSKNFFVRLNSMLRGGYNKLDSEMLNKYADIISGALRKSPTKRSFICYRGSDYDLSNNVGIGGKFKVKQFVSTSVIGSRIFSGKYKLIIYVPSGTYGAYIEKLSHYPKQREFLLDKGHIFEVVSRYENTIELEVTHESY